MMELWTSMCENDPEYVKRLERHYHEIRAANGFFERDNPHPRPLRRRDKAKFSFPVLTKQQRRARQAALEKRKRKA
jgi:hypothetical protein